MTKTDRLFTFELDMGVGEDRLTGQALEDSLPPVKAESAAPVLDELIMNRHSCRRFLKKDVDASVIDGMLLLVERKS